jgi:RHS repeat-associated protein
MKSLIGLFAVLMLLVCKAVLADVTFVHTDVLGSPVAETNSDGQLVRLSHYKPFGEELEQKKDDVASTGHKYDAALGLIYMQARYYDPVIGRFYSHDPLNTLGHLRKGDIHGFNRYSYANNNPYKYVDPDGFDSFLVSRPLNGILSSAGNHNFIVHDADFLGDPNGIVRSFGDVGNDTMGEVHATTEGFSAGTFQTDSAAWQSLSQDGSDSTFRQIDAPDNEVASLADSVKGGQEYSAVPIIQGGVNSNSAAGAIAHRADGGSAKVDNGANQPGANQHNRVEFREEQ